MPRGGKESARWASSRAGTPSRLASIPEIAHWGGLLLTWHGVFSAIGIALGVWVAVKMAARAGFIEDVSYTVALVGVPAGIVGARALFVAENHSLFAGRLLDIFRINEGGISLYGALIGGVVGGLGYGIWQRLPIRAGLDAAAFGMILGQGIGRIGDIINGEHFAKTTDLPWAVVYTHSNSPSFGRDPQHPAVAYEFLGDLLIFGLLFLFWRFYKRDGLVFFSYAFLYSVMRFGDQRPAPRRPGSLGVQDGPGDSAGSHRYLHPGVRLLPATAPRPPQGGGGVTPRPATGGAQARR